MRVLVAIDGSERSLGALPHAAYLAMAISAELVLLRVLDPRVDCANVQASSLLEATRLVTEQWLADLDARAQPLGVPTLARVVVRERQDDVGQVILRVAKAQRARLVVMGTRGRGVASRALFGSVATALLGRADVPVMMVGERVRAPDNRLPYGLLVTTDGSAAAEAVLPALRRVLEHAPAESMRLHLLRVHQPAIGELPGALELRRRELGRFRRRAPRRFPVTAEVRVDERLGGVRSTILEVAGDQHVSAIWMSTHGHSLRRETLLGSIAMDVVRRATVPVVLTRGIE